MTEAVVEAMVVVWEKDRVMVAAEVVEMVVAAAQRPQHTSSRIAPP